MEDNYNPKFEKMLEKFLKQSRDIQSDAQREHTKAERRKKKDRKNEERRLRNYGKNKKRFD